VVDIVVRWEDLSQTFDNVVDVWDEVCRTVPDPVVVHYHDYYEINFVQQGSGTYYFGDKRYRVNPGQVFVINDREPHYAYADVEGELKMIIVVFRPTLVRDGVFENREFLMPFKERSMEYRNQIVATDPSALEIGALMRLIRDEKDCARTGCRLFMQAYVYEILACLYRYYREADQIGKDVRLQREIDNIRPALAYMRENFAQNIAVKDVAALACMSPNHFSTVFKKVNRMSFRSYLTMIRLASAKEMLKTGSQSITEIALNTGFPNSAYFTRVFTREVGVTPSEYRLWGRAKGGTTCDTNPIGTEPEKD